MIETFSYALAGVIVVSSLSFAGVFTFSLRTKALQSAVLTLVAISAGALLGDAFLHLIPEAFEEGDTRIVAVVLVVGVMIFFILEKLLAWRHSHGTDEESLESVKIHDHEVIKPIGPMVLFADSIHNFVDGMVIAASFLVSAEVGIATTIAVVLHEIPQEIGDFGLLLHAGYSRIKALMYNFISALSAVVGTVFVFLLGEKASGLLPYLLAFTAGSFIYIAAADLMPEIQKTKGFLRSLLQILFVMLGLGLMVGFFFFE